MLAMNLLSAPTLMPTGLAGRNPRQAGGVVHALNPIPSHR